VANYNFGINEPPHKRWPVAWYNPAVLFRSAREMVASGNFIHNFDRRELFTDDFKIVEQATDYAGGDYWWDFMSDSGDGGNASYTVARAMQSTTLEVGLAEGVIADIGKTLPAGKLLVLGGDLAYPGASTEEYQYRFIEMWEAAKPTLKTPKTVDGKSPLTVASIPQNHDWFDNISTFNRHFIGDYGNHFLQANTPQNRSYFAAQLPHGWWILGLDFALVGDIDRTQYETFLKLITKTADTSGHINAGDNVILLYPEPYWTRPLGDTAGVGYPRRYQRLEAALLEAKVKIRVRLAGDLHHYVREEANSGAQLDYEDLLITCGSGGAFLHPTHAKRVTDTKILDRVQDTSAMTPDLENRVCVGIKNTKGLSEDQREYTHQASYPTREVSKSLCKWNLLALFAPASISGLFADNVNGNLAQRSLMRLKEITQGVKAGNILFPFLLGALYLLAVYCNSFVFSKSFEPDGFVAASEIGNKTFLSFLLLWFKALFFSPLALGVHIILLGLCGSIAHEDGGWSVFFGAIYGVVHILAAATLFWLLSKWGFGPYSKGILIFIFGTFAGGLLFGLYFALLARFGRLANNAFSPLGHQGYKGFLRFRIDSQGTLHGYMIGTDEVPKRWIFNSQKNKPPRPLWIEKNPNKAPIWKVRDAFTLSK
jgi:hypothetical protein